MTRLSDNALGRLRDAVEVPDLSGTRYHLIRKLASGGMGTVYLVEDTQLGRQVALKVLDVASTQPGIAERLNHEARIIARLEHPGIVPVHDAGALADDRIYYTMKFVQGLRLDSHIEGIPFISERLRIFQNICDTVAFAHAKGVLHRDLKPENIMVGAFGEVLVMDWGVARALDGHSASSTNSSLSTPTNPATAHGAIVGTPGYMAPEQERGEGIGEQADVYGLGAVLYFLLTNHPPTAAQHTEALQDGNMRISSPRHLNRKIARGLQSICLKALSYTPGERYTTVAELSDDIARFLNNEPVSAYHENVLERVDRWMSQNRFLVFLILAYLLMRILLILTSEG
jgi:serine/threonine protein kinase